MITGEERAVLSEAAVVVERALSASPGEVYRAFVAPQALRDWLCHAAQVEPRTGGRIYLAWNDGYHTAGKFSEVVKDRRLAFTWRGDDEPAGHVLVEIEPLGDAGSSVRVTHSAPGASREWVERARQEWEDSLEGLESMLATGIDLRLARRPMFGLTGGEMVDESMAERLNLPVKEGLKIGGLLEGGGAHKGGVQVGDVVVRMAGTPIVTYQRVGEALGKYKAGDTIPVELYRAGELLTLPVTLTARAMPDLPDTAERLVELASRLYEKVDAELDALLQGASEEEAGWRPGPDDWNIKEILAHLIACERDTQVWITSVSEDADLEQPYHTNDLTRLRGIIALNPTLGELVEGLKRAEQETLATARNLPPQAVARKHLFRNIGIWLTGFDSHHTEHFGLVRSMLEQVRRKS